MIGTGIFILLVCVGLCFIALRKPQGNPWRDGWLDHLKSEAPERSRTPRKL
jgi:hypothetical protein